MNDSSLRAALKARHERLYDALDDAGIHAIAINPGPTMGYLTGLGFHISERPAVAIFRKGERPVMVIPELEAQKTEKAEFDVDVLTYTESLSTWQPAFDKALVGLESATIGVESRWLRVLELRFLERAVPGATITEGDAPIAELRMHKDAVEIATMRRATHLAQDALRATLETVREGTTEKEAAATLIQNMLRLGSQGELPFQPIVAFGANSANPHAVPTGYALQRGDLALFDWGANVDGYFSDLTRTFYLGAIDEELATISTLVEQANAAGRAASRAGVEAGSIDRAARTVIDEGGYGHRFIHRTGHGLGLEVHEEPYIRADNDRILAPGMAFTVEPGIYLTGKGGVRIEDDVIITADGAESLSDMPRGVVALPNS